MPAVWSAIPLLPPALSPATTLALGGTGLALVAGVADARRARRRRLDRVGWVPWRGLSLLGVGAAVIGAALALLGR